VDVEMAEAGVSVVEQSPQLAVSQDLTPLPPLDESNTSPTKSFAQNSLYKPTEVSSQTILEVIEKRGAFGTTLDDLKSAFSFGPQDDDSSLKDVINQLAGDMEIYENSNMWFKM
jgi:hypothetical protein